MLNVFVAIILAVSWIALEKLICTFLSQKAIKNDEKVVFDKFPYLIKQIALIRIFNAITLILVLISDIFVNYLLVRDLLNHYGFIVIFNFVSIVFFLSHSYQILEYFFHRFYVYEDRIVEKHFKLSRTIMFTDLKFTTISDDFILFDVNNNIHFELNDYYCGITSLKKLLFSKNVEGIDYTDALERLKKSRNGTKRYKYITSLVVSLLLLVCCIVLSVVISRTEQPNSQRNELSGEVSEVSIDRTNNIISFKLHKDDSVTYVVRDVAYEISEEAIFHDLKDGKIVTVGYNKEVDNKRNVIYLSFDYNVYVSSGKWYRREQSVYRVMKNCGYIFMILSVVLTGYDIVITYTYFSMRRKD